MKLTVKILGCLVLLACLAFPAWGKGSAAVVNTKHNLSTTGPMIQYRADLVTETCVFCHTPHGGLLTGPLWNHSLPANNSFTHYNSATLSTYLQGLQVSRNISDESLLCMGCHDGSVAVNHLVNDPNTLNGVPLTMNSGNPAVEIFAFSPGTARIGGSEAGFYFNSGDLSDDHPISFSYNDVYTEYQSGSRAGQLRDVTTATTWNGEGIRFFGSDNRVECSSCHDPHVDYVSGVNNPKNYTPFLIRPNDGSNLCLACHNK